jgi:hypothetical protein
VDEGSLTMNSDAGSASASNVRMEALTESAVTLNSTQHLGELHIMSGSTVALSPAPAGQTKVLRLHHLAIGTGSLDLANNALIFEPALAPVPFESLIAFAQSVSKISSSTFAGNPSVVLAGAYARDVVRMSNGSGTYLGETVAPLSILMRFTLLGDASLDGRVDFEDLVRLAQNYAEFNMDWAHGEFTGDGEVNFNDLVVLAQNYGGGLPEFIPGASQSFNNDLAAAFAAVPEPGLAPLALMSLTFRRRRRAR